MTSKPYLEESEVLEVCGPTTPVKGFCRCRRSNLPLRVVKSTRDNLIGLCLAATDIREVFPDPEAVFLTFRCRDCKKIIQITLGALGMEP